jgi:hypothetical protein
MPPIKVSKLEKTIKGFNHCSVFLAMVESETGYRDCKTNLSPAKLAGVHMQSCKAPAQLLELLWGKNRKLCGHYLLFHCPQTKMFASYG